MDIQIGDKIEIQSDFRTQTLKATVVDITNVDGSTYFRVISNSYDYWIHISNVLKLLFSPSPILFDDSNTVVKHINDLYR